MNKLIALLLFFGLSHALEAACPKGSESGKTIIFLDLNNNPQEIESTKRAACKRGESVIVLPEKGKNFDLGTLHSVLTSFEQKGTKVNSFVISGHDGGGQFGGSNGFFSKVMLHELMKVHPETRDSVSSVLLLGCYTGVKQEIFDWKQILPSANLIAGYEGQAPLGDKPAGHSYIEGVLLKEKEMNEAKNKRALEKILKSGIKHMSTISAAMYVHPKICAPGTEHESGFYFRSLKGKDALQDLVTQECMRIKEGEGPLMLDKFMAYYRGEKEIPKQTHGTELRAIYNFFREKGHCFEGDNNYPTPDKVLFTLFFDGVKQNYAHFYEDQLEGMKGEYDDMMKNFDAKFDAYADRKAILTTMLQERMNHHEASFAEENDAISDEFQKLGTELGAKYNRFFSFNDRGENLDDLTPEDRKKYERMMALNEYSNYLYEQAFARQIRGLSDQLSSDNLKDSFEKYQGFLTQKQAYADSLKNVFEKYEPPSKEAILKASRPEILTMAHNLKKLQSLEFFNDNVPSSTTVSYGLNETLVNLNCVPFEWHEFTAASREASPTCGMMGGGNEEEGDGDEGH